MNRSTRKLNVESLTDRIVPAATLDGGTLTVTGGGDLRITQTGEQVSVVGMQIHDAATGQDRQSVKTKEVTNIVVDGDGHNLIDLRTVRFRGAFINAGPGDNTIYGSQADDIILGDSGNDLIRGEGGNDLIYGLAGKDSLYGNNGADEIHGGDGDDYIEGNQGQVVGGPCPFIRPNALYGDAGDDVIISDDPPDQMYGGEGDDLMEGNGNNDYMLGEAGNDTMSGGAGHDYMMGGEDDDIMDGDADADYMYGEAGSDQMSGGGGNDTIDSGEDDDTVDGDAGNDTIDSGDGNDIVNGGIGNDLIDAGDGDDMIRGGWGNDHIDAGDGNDQAMGEGNNDTLDMGDGNDRADGGGGNDLLIGGGGFDVLAGLEGNDILQGDEDNDDLFGGPGNDRLEGGDGDDHLTGEDGRDMLIGGLGKDNLDGGKGRDIFHGDEETEDKYDAANFDSYHDAFNLAKPVFGTAVVSDIVMQDPHLEATLAGLGAAVTKLGSTGIVSRMTVVGNNAYDIQLEGSANPTRVTFDGTWTDNDPKANGEERLSRATSGAEKQEFWPILFARARLSKYNVDPMTFHTDAAWNSMNTASQGKLFKDDVAYEDFAPSAQKVSPPLSSLTFADLQGYLKDGYGMIASAKSGTGVSSDKVELGCGYVVVGTFTAGGKQYVKLYNVSGHDTDPAGTTVDNAGAVKDDGYITLDFGQFTNAANFAELDAWK
jgi:Ca2+-binding RTX toxin-like protein